MVMKLLQEFVFATPDIGDIVATPEMVIIIIAFVRLECVCAYVIRCNVHTR